MQKISIDIKVKTQNLDRSHLHCEKKLIAQGWSGSGESEIIFLRIYHCQSFKKGAALSFFPPASPSNVENIFSPISWKLVADIFATKFYDYWKERWFLLNESLIHYFAFIWKSPL